MTTKTSLPKIKSQATAQPSLGAARIGFIGAGDFVTAQHLLTASISSIMEIKAIADIDKDRLESHRRRFEVGYTTEDYHDILSDPNVDIIVIGTKQNLHARFIIESLDAGKWVFCEKPMADTDAEAQAVLEAEKRNPGKLAIGFNRRFAPSSVKAKQLMKKVQKPWFLSYRLMAPSPDKNGQDSFYHDQPRILYEGCHILDLLCWFFDQSPQRVFMSGDRLRNNCCIIEFPCGSEVSFVCGSMGSFCFWKEYMEIFSSFHAIAISDFTDMRIRGFAGEKDLLFAPHRGERAEEVAQYGFDFYETVYANRFCGRKDEVIELMGDFHGETIIEPVRRPIPLRGDPTDLGPVNPECKLFMPDKGWQDSFEHFARSFLQGSEPQNANGQDGARSTQIALALLESLELGKPVEI